MRLWKIYHYFNHNIDTLPRAPDGSHYPALLSAMIAIDQFYEEGKAEMNQRNKEEGKGEFQAVDNNSGAGSIDIGE